MEFSSLIAKARSIDEEKSRQSALRKAYSDRLAFLSHISEQANAGKSEEELLYVASRELPRGLVHYLRKSEYFSLEGLVVEIKKAGPAYLEIMEKATDERLNFSFSNPLYTYLEYRNLAHVGLELWFIKKSAENPVFYKNIKLPGYVELKDVPGELALLADEIEERKLEETNTFLRKALRTLASVVEAAFSTYGDLFLLKRS
ncbi:MAG: hypothetical protein ACP5T4_01270 [Candidatus Micrarchaeia archaeon]